MKLFSQYICKWKLIFLKCTLIILCFCAKASYGQIQSVTTVQDIAFGAFTTGPSGGTITVDHTGNRSATGSIILLNIGQPPSPAIFDIEAPGGTIISITNSPDITLTDNNGGTISLQPGSPDTGSPALADPSGITRVFIGGTLTIGPSAVGSPGNYAGSFYIIFNNE